MIYFLLNRRARAVKIGLAHDVEQRVRSLRTASPDPLTLLGAVAGDAITERRLHRRFAGKRVRGEWFRADGELMAAIAGLVGGSEEPRAGRATGDLEVRMRREAVRVANEVHFPVGWAHGHPALIGPKYRGPALQIMPEPGYDDGDTPSADFWWWYIDSPQWFATPEAAADAFIAAFRVWEDQAGGPSCPQCGGPADMGLFRGTCVDCYAAAKCAEEG